MYVIFCKTRQLTCRISGARLEFVALASTAGTLCPERISPRKTGNHSFLLSIQMHTSPSVPIYTIFTPFPHSTRPTYSRQINAKVQKKSKLSVFSVVFFQKAQTRLSFSLFHFSVTYNSSNAL